MPAKISTVLEIISRRFLTMCCMASINCPVSLALHLDSHCQVTGSQGIGNGNTAGERTCDTASASNSNESMIPGYAIIVCNNCVTICTDA